MSDQPPSIKEIKAALKLYFGDNALHQNHSPGGFHARPMSEGESMDAGTRANIAQYLHDKEKPIDVEGFRTSEHAHQLKVDVYLDTSLNESIREHPEALKPIIADMQGMDPVTQYHVRSSLIRMTQGTGLSHQGEEERLRDYAHITKQLAQEVTKAHTTYEKQYHEFLHGPDGKAYLVDEQRSAALSREASEAKRIGNDDLAAEKSTARFEIDQRQTEILQEHGIVKPSVSHIEKKLLSDYMKAKQQTAPDSPSNDQAGRAPASSLAPVPGLETLRADMQAMLKRNAEGPALAVTGKAGKDLGLSAS